MNDKKLNILPVLLMILCAASFGYFVPDILINEGIMPDHYGLRLLVSVVGGGLIGILWPTPMYIERT